MRAALERGLETGARGAKRLKREKNAPSFPTPSPTFHTLFQLPSPPLRAPTPSTHTTMLSLTQQKATLLSGRKAGAAPRASRGSAVVVRASADEVSEEARAQERGRASGGGGGREERSQGSQVQCTPPRRYGGWPACSRPSLERLVQGLGLHLGGCRGGCGAGTGLERARRGQLPLGGFAPCRCEQRERREGGSRAGGGGGGGARLLHWAAAARTACLASLRAYSARDRLPKPRPVRWKGQARAPGPAHVGGARAVAADTKREGEAPPPRPLFLTHSPPPPPSPHDRLSPAAPPWACWPVRPPWSPAPGSPRPRTAR